MSLKSHLSIPAEHVIKAYKNSDEASGFLGFRMPGIDLAGILTAGTFRMKGSTIFCDFTNHEKIIVVDLKDETLTRLLIEVEDVEKSLELLTAK